MVAQNCWEEYLANVHSAVPMDPWDTNLQLFDVLVENDEGSGSLWARLRRLFGNTRSRGKVIAPSKVSRVGSLLELGDIIDANEHIHGTSWRMNVENAIYEGLSRLIDEENVIEFGSSKRHDLAMVPDTKSSNTTAGLTPPMETIIMTSVQDWFKKQSLPDINTSITSSSSLLGSLGLVSSSASGQFDAMDSKTVKCNVTGVISNRVNIDALTKLVGMGNSTTKWKPDISQPRLQWSLKR